MAEDTARLWSMLVSDDPATRAQGRELAVQMMSIDAALTLMDRAAREHHLQEVDRRLAGEVKLTTAAAALLKHRATLLGLDQPTAPPEPMEEDLTPPADPVEHRQQLVRSVRRARLRAEAQGSWVAVATLMRQEDELVRSMTPDDGPVTEAELVAEMREALAAFPPALRARILAALHHDPDPGPDPDEGGEE